MTSLVAIVVYAIHRWAPTERIQISTAISLQIDCCKILKITNTREIYVMKCVLTSEKD